VGAKATIAILDCLSLTARSRPKVSGSLPGARIVLWYVHLCVVALLAADPHRTGNKQDAARDVAGGPSAVHIEGLCALIWGDGNIDADPLFVDPDGPDNDPNTWEDKDYHLSPGSPCIDAGCNGAVPRDFADLAVLLTMYGTTCD